MAETLFEELKRYVGFNDADEQALRAFHPIAAPRFAHVAGIFYQRILEHEQARKALANEAQVGKLKVTLIAWMDELLRGPWDAAYFEKRCKIGRVHVRIALPQHYMFGAMNVLRRELNDLIDAEYRDRLAELGAVRAGLSKMIDMELAIMLHTYREDLLALAARHERLSTFGQLVGSIGHELRNPLGVMETSLFIIKKRIGDDERAQKHVERIGEQLVIANQIVSDLLDMIRDRPLNREQVELKGVIGRVLDVVKRPEAVRVTLENLDTLSPVEGDANQLRQVFVNLIENAVHAVGPTGEIRIVGSSGTGGVEIAVEDSGPGVDETTRRRLFEPLITTKEKGIGLGLSLVRRILERHGGTVSYEPTGKPGARFVLRFKPV